MTAPVAPHLLTRGRHKAKVADALPLVGDDGLAPARVHEMCGPSRATLALAVAGGTAGPVIWIAPGWGSEKLHADGAREWVDPGRLIFVAPKRLDEMLWAMEEALRSGAVALVVADLPEAPALTPVRRLQLAAETGAATGAVRPTGLLLTPGDGGAPGVESRWWLAPRHRPDGDGWRLDRRRARMAPETGWDVARAATTGFRETAGAATPGG